MFVPIHDRNPLKSIRFQYVTVTLIAINTAIFLIFQSGLILGPDNDIVATFAVIPVELLSQGSVQTGPTGIGLDVVPVPERMTLLTYMFFHGSWLHLIGNMLFLWVFGDNVEDAMGHVRFIMFYLMCGIFAGVVHSVVMRNSDLPLIGASGAVAGVVAAYLMLHPKVKFWALALWKIPLKISAAWALGFWAALQFVSAVLETGDQVAWWAHVGGLVAGALLILFMRRPGVPLFDRTPGGA